MLARLPLHPALAAGFPVLLLWALNVREVRPGDAVRVLLVAVVVVVAVTVVAALALRSARRGALVGSVAALVVLGHGHLWTPAQALLPGLPVAALALAAGVWWATRVDRDVLGPWTLGLNVVLGGLVLATLPAVLGGTPWAETATALEPVRATLPADRDIIWIVPDRYGREDVLGDVLDVDTAPFVAALEDRGLAVADAATTNYPATSHALSADLNMAYLDELLGEVPPAAEGGIAPLYPLLRDHRLGQAVTDAGYEYVHVGNWWSPTSTAVSADVVLNRDPRSEFAEVFEGTTILPAVRRVAGGPSEVSDRERKRADAAWQLDTLDELVADIAADTDDQPRFVFAHVTLPHGPYVFDRDGTPVDPPYEPFRTRDEQYGRQTAYLDQRLLGMLDVLLALPEEEQPVVVLHADEGPHPLAMETRLGDAYRWDEASEDDLRAKLSVLSAFHLPGVDAEAVVPEDISGVNVMRLVLDTYLGTDLGMLPDRALVYPDNDHRYEFRDVSDVVRGG